MLILLVARAVRKDPEVPTLICFHIITCRLCLNVANALRKEPSDDSKAFDVKEKDTEDGEVYNNVEGTKNWKCEAKEQL